MGSLLSPFHPRVEGGWLVGSLVPLYRPSRDRVCGSVPHYCTSYSEHQYKSQ